MFGFRIIDGPRCGDGPAVPVTGRARTARTFPPRLEARAATSVPRRLLRRGGALAGGAHGRGDRRRRPPRARPARSARTISLRPPGGRLMAVVARSTVRYDPARVGAWQRVARPRRHLDGEQSERTAEPHNVVGSSCGVKRTGAGGIPPPANGSRRGIRPRPEPAVTSTPSIHAARRSAGGATASSRLRLEDFGAPSSVPRATMGDEGRRLAILRETAPTWSISRLRAGAGVGLSCSQRGRGRPGRRRRGGASALGE